MNTSIALTVSDVQRNLARLRPSLSLSYWNLENFKVGLCTTCGHHCGNRLTVHLHFKLGPNA